MHNAVPAVGTALFLVQLSMCFSTKSPTMRSSCSTCLLYTYQKGIFLFAQHHSGHAQRTAGQFALTLLSLIHISYGKFIFTDTAGLRKRSNITDGVGKDELAVGIVHRGVDGIAGGTEMCIRDRA